jgi:hypothetical protein
MYSPVDAFRHDWHASPAGGNVACKTCHTPGQRRTVSNAKACDACHTDLYPAGATITVDAYRAPSYTDAMHGLCVDCHRREAAERPERESLAICSTCHATAAPEHLRAEMSEQLAGPYYNKVVLPGVTDVSAPESGD